MRSAKTFRFREVLPLTREWIEITFTSLPSSSPKVLPLTREWIEIEKPKRSGGEARSSPSCEGVD